MTGRRRSWAAAAVQWRNWPVLVKIGAVLVVPVVGAVLLGVLRVQADVALANSYGDVERLAALRAELVPTLSTIQRERNLAMQLPDLALTYEQQTQSVDVNVAGLDKLVHDTPDLGTTADAGYTNLKRAFGTLTGLRQQVRSGAESTVMLNGYDNVTQAVLDFDRSLVGRFPDQELTGYSVALFDLQAAREQVTLQQALVLAAIRRGELTPIETEQLIQADVRLADRVSDVHSVAPTDLWQQYLENVTGKDVERRLDLVALARTGQPQARRGPGKPTMPFAAPEWNSTSDITSGLMTQVTRTAATQLRNASSSLQDATSSRAGTQSVLLLAMVLLAAAIGGVVGRYLLRSLNTLRKTALDVASTRLPEAVANIRAGRKAEIEPVPVRTREEFGQLARAFDTVHDQAVRSAEEEAKLRGNLRDIFVNLSRRSQSLVERQLKLMEQLEQKETDPDQLANLFKLDHLATRMRRNNENLVVLSGADLGRRFTDHVPLSRVLRAAVSEVEHYERAVVQSAPRVDVLGYAAGDLVRSIAELVENATAFSPPDTDVVISGRREDGGSVVVEIVDDGIGMGDAELAEANGKLSAGGGVDAPVSRQMGLFVVGSLANRHGIQVTLARRDSEGLVAAVRVPVDLIATTKEPEPRKVTGTLDVKPAPVPVSVSGSVSGPAERGLAAQLKSVGIFVELPRLPVAKSPASILFRSDDPPPPPMTANPAEQGFAWLAGGPAAEPPTQRVAAPVVKPLPAQKPGELPKRVPQANLQAPARAAANTATTNTARPAAPRRPVNAERARGFLTSFQAGVRLSKADGAGNGPMGEEKP
ncbi:sensor histidine kinase [Actinocrispum wychmicini]|uniref:histidine kinase n=1 Tax=Actinocrispum wychmicini TaxID=1213861 RepID=A0A4R2JAL2_9PSEU|nr:nitrate- and nitrite sensing domain-containing protein [Actinocrispum wychmicini]TCO53698.1 signal transduction histidine kinase [Actinocrispum wychmicini]